MHWQPLVRTLWKILDIFFVTNRSIFLLLWKLETSYFLLFFCLYKSAQAEIRINHVGLLVTDIWAISQKIRKMNKLLYGTSLHNQDTYTLFFAMKLKYKKALKKVSTYLGYEERCHKVVYSFSYFLGDCPYFCNQ